MAASSSSAAPAVSASSASSAVCPVCCEPFSKQHRKKIECLGCAYEACSKCLRQYILCLPRDPECMSCHRFFDTEFLARNFGPSFVATQYRAHRENVLLEREVALLPETQPCVVNFRAARALRLEVADAEKQIQEHHDALNGLLVQKHYARRRADRITGSGYLSDGRQQDAGAEGATRERRTRHFMMRCPRDDCRGFVSAPAWVCGICAAPVCEHCLEETPPDAEAPDAEAGHQCDPAKRASAALLKRETRACPKCAVPIFKIDGCFAPDTPVLLASGATVAVGDLAEGDRLRGDDGTPREVLDLCRGTDAMYDVRQTRGVAYRVNGKHTLVCTFGGDRVLELTVDEFRELPRATQVLLYGFKGLGAVDESRLSVTPAGAGEYCGVRVAGPSKRFLLADGTVVHNCDQMWCTQCHVSFSWITGKREEGLVHNPHFYAWLRTQSATGEIPRNPDDDPGGGPGGPCDRRPRHARYPDHYRVRQWCSARDVDTTEVLTWYRLGAHILAVDIPKYTQPRDNDESLLRLLRIQYLDNALDKDEWKRRLVLRERKRARDEEHRQIFDMVSTVIADTVHGMLADRVAPGDGLFGMRAMVRHANDAFADVARRYACARRHIPFGQ